MGIMLGLGAMVGWVIPRMLTSSTSENTRIAIVPGTAPYENGDHKGGYKFKYVPMGSDGQVREGPAALNAVIVPDMNLPRVSDSIPGERGSRRRRVCLEVGD